MNNKKEEVINELLVENYEKYYRLAYGYVRNENDALDIVQEGAYKAIFNSDKLRDLKYADTWICRIIINEAIENLRNRVPDYEEISSNEERIGENAALDGTGFDDLKDALEKLSPKEKTVIMLRYFEDMSLEQVSLAAGENLSTVKSRLYRALGKLKLNLSDI